MAESHRERVESSVVWRTLAQGNGLTPGETSELSPVLAGGLLASVSSLRE
jgi:hypothetical protein